MDLPAMQEWGRLAHAELTRGESMSASLPEAGAGPGNARADPSGSHRGGKSAPDADRA